MSSLTPFSPDTPQTGGGSFDKLKVWIRPLVADQEFERVAISSRPRLWARPTRF
jgi:hypothetical protein